MSKSTNHLFVSTDLKIAMLENKGKWKLLFVRSNFVKISRMSADKIFVPRTNLFFPGAVEKKERLMSDVAQMLWIDGQIMSVPQSLHD